MSGCFDGLGWRASCCPSCCPPHGVCACVPVTNNGLSPPTSLSAFLLRPSPFLVAFALFLGAGPDSVHCMSWAGSVGAQRNHHRTDDLTMPKRIVRYFRRAPHYGVLNYSKPPPRVNDEPSARPSATRDPRHANAPSPPSQPPSVSPITTVRDAPSALDQPVPPEVKSCQGQTHQSGGGNRVPRCASGQLKAPSHPQTGPWGGARGALGGGCPAHARALTHSVAHATARVPSTLWGLPLFAEGGPAGYQPGAGAVMQGQVTVPYSASPPPSRGPDEGARPSRN